MYSSIPALGMSLSLMVYGVVGLVLLLAGLLATIKGRRK